MNKYAKLIAGNAAFAAAAVCLYSPGLLGLSPFSPSAAVAAASIAVGVIAVPTFVWMNKCLLAEKEIKLLGSGEEKSEEKAIEFMEAYRSSKVLGGIAKSAVSQMKRMENVQANYEKLVVRRFGQDTLSYQKFMAVIHSAAASFANGYVKMANKMIIFDEAEYQKLTTDDYRKDDIPDDIQEKKRDLYEKNLGDLRFVLEKNEEILLGIDQLMIEMSNVDYSEHDIGHAAEEIDVLLKQLEYYKK